MVVWRISKKKYALDRIGVGAMKTGGRWNSIDVPVIYTGMSVEIAALEKLVHISDEMPDDLVLTRITLPDDPVLYWDVPIKDLPKDWNEMPSSITAQQFGNNFIIDGKYLGIIVPSAVIPEGRNMLLNPNHHQFKHAAYNVVRDFKYDSRIKIRNDNQPAQ